MKRIFATCVVAFVTTVVASAASASSGRPTVPPDAIADSHLKAVADGCSDHAVGSNFHERIVSQPILPQETLPADALSVPTWASSFTSNGAAFPYTMVGTDPATGSTTTHVPVEIVPLSLDFAANGCVLGDSGMAADIEASPLFTATYLRTGLTQYLDDIQRGSFW